MKPDSTRFTQDIFDEICERMSDGESLRDICKADDMPNKATVFRWLANDQALSDQYARAREVQADAIFDECLSIADNAENDWMERNAEGNEGWAVNGEHLQRSRLRIDTRKWMAGKLRPKKYGDKLAIGGDKEMDPIQNEEVGTGSEKLAAVLEMIASRQVDDGAEPS